MHLLSIFYPRSKLGFKPNRPHINADVTSFHLGPHMPGNIQ